MATAAGRRIAHPREAGAGALLQVALRAEDPDRDARNPSHVLPCPAARFLRDVVPARADGGRRNRRHRSGGSREEHRLYVRLAGRQAAAGARSRSLGPRARRDARQRHRRSRRPGDRRHAAAQDAGAAAEPCRRLPPRSGGAADVPAAEHPVRRPGAEAGRAVARGRRRQERHRRIHHGCLAWRTRRGREDRRGPERDHPRGQAGARIRVQRRRIGSGAPRAPQLL